MSKEVRTNPLWSKGIHEPYFYSNPTEMYLQTMGNFERNESKDQQVSVHHTYKVYKYWLK